MDKVLGDGLGMNDDVVYVNFDERQVAETFKHHPGEKCWSVAQAKWQSVPDVYAKRCNDAGLVLGSRVHLHLVETFECVAHSIVL